MERARAAIDRVGLSHRVDYLPSKLSGGERQRVAIARAIIGSPSLLFCDEPTGNLDSKSTASILDLFQTLNQQGLTLVVVTHDEDVAKRASRRVQIVDGRLTDVTAISGCVDRYGSHAGASRVWRRCLSLLRTKSASTKKRFAFGYLAARSAQ